MLKRSSTDLPQKIEDSILFNFVRFLIVNKSLFSSKLFSIRPPQENPRSAPGKPAHSLEIKIFKPVFFEHVKAFLKFFKSFKSRLKELYYDITQPSPMIICDS